MTIGHYLSKFEELSKFSSYLRFNLDEYWKSMKFESSLKPVIKNTISTMEIRNYALLVNKCRIIKQNLNDLAVEHQNMFKRRREEDRNKMTQPRFQKNRNRNLNFN